MKKTRKIAAMIAAMALTATMAVPSMMMSASAATGGTNTITVTNQDSATHTYAAYQIFSGNYSGNTLNDIQWGDGVNGAAILTALHTASSTNGNALYGLFPETGTDAVTDAKGVAAVLGAQTTDTPPISVFGNDSEKAQAFAAIVGANLTSNTSGTVSGNTISGLPDGYYLVQDTAAPTNPDANSDGVPDGNNSGAKTRFIVHVTDNATVTVNAKHSAPTVDKTVQDEIDDAEAGADASGYGETADHAINESFNFKLTATLAADPDYGSYDTYKIQFNDTLSAGVTYENIVSVKVGSTTVPALSGENGGYELTAPTYDATTIGGGALTISIADIKKFDANLTDGATVEVIYSAHLNANATVETGSHSDVATTYNNVNKVNLQYSNNPNAGGSGELGQTPDDYVWVFTYEVDNIKHNENSEPMSGAGFTLYTTRTGTEGSYTYSSPVKLIDNTDGTYTVADQTATADGVTQMVSSNVTGQIGKFNIKGLDAGTYYLVETHVPDGYNKCEDLTVTIGATHSENTGGQTANLTFSGTNNNNTITNQKGHSLPSTGGMGTTLFILGGGVTAAAAGIYLVSKKRAKEEEAQ